MPCIRLGMRASKLGERGAFTAARIAWRTRFGVAGMRRMQALAGRRERAGAAGQNARGWLGGQSPCLGKV